MTQRKDAPPKLQVEALLFSSGRTMSEEQLAALTKLDPRTVKKALHTLQEEYAARDSAITIFNDDTGWKMMIRESYVPVVKNIVSDTELSRACMETLAVIAYKYPKVLQSEVIDIRGSGAYEHMAELEKLSFISRTPEGRSYAVKLTEKFFTYFDVAGGKDIRQVFKNVKVPQRVAEQKTLGDLPVVDMVEQPKTVVDMVEQPKTEAEKVLNATKLGMEVVDVPQQQEPLVQQQVFTDEEKQQHSDYLDDLDARIAKLQQRNDEIAKDPAFQRKPLPGMEDAEKDSE
jgi:segregation and condensation protein B